MYLDFLASRSEEKRTQRTPVCFCYRNVFLSNRVVIYALRIDRPYGRMDSPWSRLIIIPIESRDLAVDARKSRCEAADMFRFPV